tara:strand:+ start:1545 stop:2981 length:1437 start_codon:yes stop_codon:yes gene_type:complete
MTKISFDVDFSKDPEKILQEIQERAKAEVEKRESKERNAAYLSKLHEKVNEKIGTEYKSVSDLIRALTPFAAPSLRDKLSGTTASGRRKTITMNKDVYEEVKKLLSEPNPNKAAIARQTGISVVQVRKVADGGFDEKFGGVTSTSTVKTSPPNKSIPEPLPPIEEPEKESVDDTPAPPAFEVKDDSPLTVEKTNDEPVEENLPNLPTFEDDNEDAPPPPPVDLSPPSTPDLPPATPVFEDKPVSQDDESQEDSDDLLPPLPKFTPAPFDSDDEPAEDDASETTSPPLPSFGDEENEAVLPPPVDLTSPPSPVNEEESESTEGVLPPLPNFSPAPLDAPEDSSDDNVPPLPSPSFGGEENDSPMPPPAPSVDLPPPPPAPLVEEDAATPEEEPVSESEAPSPAPEEVPSAPPSPPPMAPPAPSAPTGGLTRPPSGLKPTLKPKLGAGKKGKPTLSLKPKSKTTGLKITRPPMRGNPPPS